MQNLQVSRTPNPIGLTAQTRKFATTRDEFALPMRAGRGEDGEVDAEPKTFARRPDFAVAGKGHFLRLIF